MARMDRLITITAGDFSTKTWAERIDRPSGEFERDDFYGHFNWTRSFRIRYQPDLAGVAAQSINVTDDEGQNWTTQSVQESADRNRYMTLECSHG